MDFAKPELSTRPTILQSDLGRREEERIHRVKVVVGGLEQLKEELPEGRR